MLDAIHQGNINLIALLGITVGTGPGTHNPDAPVTRAQMATFLVRALGLWQPGKHSFRGRALSPSPDRVRH